MVNADYSNEECGEMNLQDSHGKCRIQNTEFNSIYEKAK